MAKKKRNSSRRSRPKSPERPGSDRHTSGMASRSSLTAILDRARRLYYANRPNEAVALLENLPDDQQPDGDRDRSEYLRLFSFSLANMNRPVEAQEMADRGLRLYPDDRDFHFVRAFIATGFKDYGTAIEHAERYFALLQGPGKISPAPDYLSEGQEFLLHNYLGLAFKAREEYSRAVASFERAIAADPRYNHAYLNLGNLYLQKREYDLADEVVEEGLKRCSQVQELKLLKKALRNRQTISACMIVKNEEELLPQCLNSIRNWVDEIIVVDTGSTDRTVEIAESFGARVFHQEWTKDFSFHRNYSIDQATGDWIFIIDADEEFVENDLASLRRSLSQDKYRIISINVYNLDQDTGQVTSFLPSVRFFRRDAEFRYDGIVHNQLQYDLDEEILRLGIRLNHYGYNLSAEKMQRKMARSRELLEKQLTDDPDNCFVHFNYAQLLRSGAEKPDPETCRTILKHAARAVELSSDDPFYGPSVGLMARHQLITTCIALKDYTAAEKRCFEALEIKPDYLDPLLSLAHIYVGRKQLDKAEEYYNKYLDTLSRYDESRETNNLIQIYLGYRHAALYGLGLIYLSRGGIDEGLDYLLQCRREQPRFSDTNTRIARIYLDLRQTEKALEVIRGELDWHPESARALQQLAEYYAQTGDRSKTEQYLERAASLADGDIEVYKRAAVFWMNQRDYNRAKGILEQALAVDVNDVECLKMICDAYYRAGNYEKATGSFEKYLNYRPDDAEAINDLANCYYKLEDYSRAEAGYTRALSANRNLAVIYRNLGLTKMALEKYKEAHTLLLKYSESSPEDIDILLVIGNISRNLGASAEAIEFFEKYLAGHPGSIEGLFNIAECYYDLGYRDSAAIGYTQVLRLDSAYEPALARLREIETTRNHA